MSTMGSAFFRAVEHDELRISIVPCENRRFSGKIIKYILNMIKIQIRFEPFFIFGRERVPQVAQ